MASASDEKWLPFSCFFSRVRLRTYQHSCITLLLELLYCTILLSFTTLNFKDHSAIMSTGYCQSLISNIAHLRQRCHNTTVSQHNSVTTQQCYNKSVTTQRCHNTTVSQHNGFTTQVSQHNGVTTQQCHNTMLSQHNSVTTQQCHNSKFVIF